MPDARRSGALVALLVSLPALASAATPSLSPDEKLRQNTAAVLKHFPRVEWRLDQIQIGDVTWRRRSDAVVLGAQGDEAVLAILPAPVTRASQPLLFRLHRAKSRQPRPEDLCGDPRELTLSLEPPGVKPAALKCAGPTMTPECQKVLDTEVRLQRVRAHRGLGIKLSGSNCPPLHIFLDGGAFQAWRDDPVPHD